MTTAISTTPTSTYPAPQPVTALEGALRRLLRTDDPSRRLSLRHPRSWLRTARSLHRLGGVSTGNQVRVFCDGDALLDSLWADIEAASQGVWIETYGLGFDRVGRRTIEALERARERGCDVILIYDCVGSRPIRDSWLTGLKERGAMVVPFNPIFVWPLPRLFTRDHRKISIIDQRIAYCGGMNISEEYAGERYGIARFHDCQLRLEGPCVADLARILQDSLREAGCTRNFPPVRHSHMQTRAPAHSAEGVLVQVLGSNARRNIRSIQRALRCAVRRATTRCWLTTPYFIPPLRLSRAMSHAAKRGVDVRLLTAGTNDVPIARWAGRYVYARLLRDGVRIYEMFGETLHTKRATVDGLLGTIGSFNLDTWSDRRNLEVTASLLDPKLVRELDAHFERDLESSKEVTLETMQREPWHRRLIAWMAYQVLRW